MGGKSSTTERKISQLGKDEINYMNELFKRVCQEKSSKGCTYNDFLQFCEVLHPLLTQFLMDFYFGSFGNNGVIKSAKEFSYFFTIFVRGSLEERTKLMEYILLNISLDSSTDIFSSKSSIQRRLSPVLMTYDVDELIFINKLENYLKGLICSYIKMEYHRQMKEFWSWRKVKSSFSPNDVDKFAAALHKFCPQPETSHDVQRFITKWKTLNELHNVVYTYLYRLEESTHETIPTLYPLCKSNRKISSCLMDMCSIVHVNCYLQSEYRKVWRLLYSSAIHGENFQHMMEQIAQEGPTIVVIKDKKGHIFGGFASESWHSSRGFYGNYSSFVFQLSPNLTIYESSRLDENFQYVNTKSNSKGIGMGKGAMDMFGWWIEPDRLKGSCAISCTTFKDLPVVASSQKFQIESIEVWAVTDASHRARKSSIRYSAISEAYGGSSSFADTSTGGSVIGHVYNRGKYTDGYKTARAASKWSALRDEGEKHVDAGNTDSDSENDTSDDDNGFEDYDYDNEAYFEDDGDKHSINTDTAPKSRDKAS